MTRGEAIIRLNEGVGFRASGHLQEPVFIKRLKEAQKDLESGKTLPRFLLLEDQTLVLQSGNHSAPLPTGFLREDDDNRLHFTSQDTNAPLYLQPARYHNAVISVVARQHPDEPQLFTLPPSIYVIRNSTVDFISIADRDYALTWNYYKADAILDTDIENLWLANAPDWLIGEAGERIARSLRDQDALAEFQELKTKGRAACFGDIIADEDSMGPIQMGAFL